MRFGRTFSVVAVFAALTASWPDAAGNNGTERLWVLWERQSPQNRPEYHSLYVRDMQYRDVAGIAEILGQDSMQRAEEIARGGAPWRVAPRPEKAAASSFEVRRAMTMAARRIETANQRTLNAQAQVLESRAQAQTLIAMVKTLQDRLREIEADGPVAEEEENPMRGLTAVYYNPQGVNAPRDFLGGTAKDFEEALLVGIRSRLNDVGIRLMTLEEYEASELQPQISVALTPGQMELSCPVPFSVAVQLSIAAPPEPGKTTARRKSVWYRKGGPTDEFPDQELEATLRLVDAFVVDYIVANEETEIEPIAQKEMSPAEAARAVEMAQIDETLRQLEAEIAAGPVPVPTSGAAAQPDLAGRTGVLIPQTTQPVQGGGATGALVRQ